MRDEVRACLVSLQADEAGWVAVFRFPEELAVFAGHFPGAPLVPAVHLVEAARLTLERGLDVPLRLLEIVDARFTAPVGPGDDVEVEVRAEPPADENDWRAKAVVRRGDEVAARLRLRLGRRAAR